MTIGNHFRASDAPSTRRALVRALRIERALTAALMFLLVACCVVLARIGGAL